MEESVAPTGCGQQLGVAAEIGADGREMAIGDGIDAYGLEVELRPCHRQEDVDGVVAEERGKDGCGGLLKGL